MEERSKALAFLRENLPQSDLDCYPWELFEQFADHALGLREAAPLCKALDWEIFAHYVLFPRVNDEDLSFHRAIFHESLWPRIARLPTQEDRALEVNRWCHEHASYEAQDERTAAPLTVFRNGSGRCGEESAFLVSALRSVGVPARQVYAPRWSHCDDNHAWVEVLCGETWRFMGACEPEPVLDRGWFLTAASRAALVHSRTFGAGNSPLHGAFLGREGAVCWWNQTARYAETKTYAFRALADGAPAAGAVFRLQILNESAFHTIAVLKADQEGAARAELGLGSLYVTAEWNGLAGEGFCGEDGITLELTAGGGRDGDWENFAFRAPEGSSTPPPPLSAERKAERAAVLRRGGELRRAWTASHGNAGEIEAFLAGDRPAEREKLVRTLSAKDLRDVTRETLEAHFSHLPPRGGDVPEEVYWRYVAGPRIALEKLTPWREPLRRWLKDWRGGPAELWAWLEEAAGGEPAEVYRNLYWTPDRIPEAGRCDEKSRRTLFIAALRTLGVPARLRTLDGEPEVWRDGGFFPVRPQKTGTLLLDGPEQPWTLSRWGGDGWRQLRTEGRRDWTLPVGCYRLITSVRLPDGGQLASKRDFTLEAERVRRLELPRLTYCWEDVLTRRAMPEMSAETLTGARIPDIFRQDGRPALALWLEEGGEPTEHVLNELSEYWRALDELEIRVLFLVKSRKSVEQPTLAKTLAHWDRPQVLLDDWAYDLETAARYLGRDPDTPPLAVVCGGGGEAAYSVSGYQVGSVSLLAQAAKYLCGHG